MSRPKGYKHSAETRVKQSNSAKGRVMSSETKAKLSAIVSASMTPERRELQRQSATGRSPSEETRKKLRAHRHTEETKAQIGAARMGHEVSGSTRQKIGAKLKGHPVSSETRAKIADKLRPIGSFIFRGGQIAEDFAGVLCPVGFIREHHVLWGKGNDRFVLDFAHIEGKVNIELDGPTHNTTQERDALRDRVLTALGWRIIRIKV